MTIRWKGSQQSQHNQHLPQSRFASQTSLPRQSAHGQRNRRQAQSFARLISISNSAACQRPYLLPEIPSVHAQLGHQAGQPDCWRAEQLAWLAAGSATTAVIQQLGRSNGLQQQGHCSSQTFQARMVVPRKIHLPDSHQPPMWHDSRAPQMAQRVRRHNAQRCWITRAAARC